MAFSSRVSSSGDIFASSFESEKLKKPKNFDKYNTEIKEIKKYIKAKREAFYKNNNLKEI